MNKLNAVALAADLNKRRQGLAYDDLIAAYNMTGNGLLLWRAFLYRRQRGLTIPKDLLDWLTESAELLMVAARKPKATAKDFGAAFGLKAAAREFTAWDRAEQALRKTRALRRMDHLVRAHRVPVSKAAAEVARDGLKPGTLAKEFSVQKVLPKKRRVS